MLCWCDITKLKVVCLLLGYILPCVARLAGNLTDGYTSHNVHSNTSYLKSQHLSERAEDRHEKVLVIGAAGFIGFHLMERLLIHRSDSIRVLTGMDNFNVDHSVRLKRQRAEYLENKYQLRIRSSHRNTCNTKKLSARLSEQQYSHIFLMAPPASSTFSNPDGIDVMDRKNYVKQSAHCFSKVLRAIVSASELHKNSPKLMYALPSPLHLSSDPLSQTRIWEMEMRSAMHSVAHQFFHHHGLLSVGMYFDVVYGPWDNPDSAISSWAASVYQRRPVHVSTELMLQARQYSFVEDVVRGIVRVMDYSPMKPVVLDMTAGEQFVPVLTDTLSIFRGLEYSTKKNFSLVLNTDSSDHLYLGKITESWIDTSVLPAAAEIKYSPVVPLQKGIERFVEWFRHYESRILPCASECVGDGVALGGRSSSFNEELCFSSVWDRVATLTQQITAGCTNVYYTVAIDSTVDGLHPLAKFEDENSQLHCNIAFVSKNSPFVLNNDTNRFTAEQLVDLEQFSYENWTVVLVDEFTAFTDPRKPTRVPKLSPSKFFAPSARYAVYMDSKLLITSDLREYVAMMPAEHEGNKNKGPLSLLAVRISEHPAGIFYHIDHVLKRTAERPSITFYDQILRQQKRAYREYEDRLGVKFVNIFDGAFMIHDLRSAAGRDFRCAWYREYQQWSDRDQVAVSYILTRKAQQLGSKAASSRKQFIPIGEEPRVGAGLPQGVESATGGGAVITSTVLLMQALASDVHNLSGGSSMLPSGFLDTSKLLRNFSAFTTASTASDANAVAYIDTSDGAARQLSHNMSKKAVAKVDQVHFVRLLPRLEYHWTYHSERIGRLEFFEWNRMDDEKYKNMASILLEMERRRLMKQCLRYGLIMVAVLLVGAAGLRAWRSFIRCIQQRTKRQCDP